MRLSWQSTSNNARSSICGPLLYSLAESPFEPQTLLVVGICTLPFNGYLIVWDYVATQLLFRVEPCRSFARSWQCGWGVRDITVWAQEHFWKLLLVNTSTSENSLTRNAAAYNARVAPRLCSKSVGTSLTCLQSRPVANWKCVVHYEVKLTFYTSKTPYWRKRCSPPV